MSDTGGAPDGGGAPDAPDPAPAAEQDAPEPDAPENPAEPDAPKTPAEPDAQEEPAEPDAPENPAQPGAPDAQTEPNAPQEEPNPSQDDPQDAAPDDNTCNASDDQHDWVKDTLGLDPRSYGADPPDAGADPGAPDDTADAPQDTRPDADGDGPSGAPDPTDPADPQDGGAPGANPADGGAPNPADGAGGAPAASPDGAGGAGGANPADAKPEEKPAEEGVIDSLLDRIGMGPKAKEAAAKKAVVDDAVNKVRTKSDEDIAAMGADDKARLVQDITSNGEPKGFDRGIQKRIYENTPTDPEYLKKQDQQSDDIAKQLAADPDMQKAQANWPTMSDDEKAATLKKVVEAQSKAMGIPAPEIVVDNGMKEGGQTVDGVYKDDGKLHVNMDKDAMASSLPGALSIAAHENTHHYQQDLVNRLNNGQLKEGDPEYNQAKMFAVNNGPHGYIDPAEGLDSYKHQPVERDAWNNGNRTSRKIMNGLGGQP